MSRAFRPTARALRVSYRANRTQPGFTTAAQFGLRVRARVCIRATRARVRNGHSALFTYTFRVVVAENSAFLFVRSASRGAKVVVVP